MPDLSIRISAQNLTQAQFRQLQADVKKTAQQFEAAEVSVDKLGKSGRDAVSNLRREIRETEGSFSNLAFTAGAVAASIALLTRGALDAAISYDNLRRGLTAVAGSAEEADRQLVRLKEVAKLPGLGFEEAIQGSIRLQAVGFQAGRSEEILQVFGNALATVGGGRAELDGVTLALTQMASKGKVLAEEINQLAERVPQVRQAMIETFGTAETEQIQRMGVDVETFVSGLIFQLNKLPPVTNSVANSVENLSDTWRETQRLAGQVLIPAFQRILAEIDKVLKAFNSLSETQRSFLVWGGVTVGAVTGVIAVLATIAAVLPTVISGVKALGAALTFLSANPIALAVAGFGALLAIGLKVKGNIDDMRRANEGLNAALEDQNRILSANQIQLAHRRIEGFNREIKDTEISIRALEAGIEATQKRLDRLAGSNKPLEGVLSQRIERDRKGIEGLQAQIAKLEAEITRIQTATQRQAPEAVTPESAFDFDAVGQEISAGQKAWSELERQGVETRRRQFEQAEDVRRQTLQDLVNFQNEIESATTAAQLQEIDGRIAGYLRENGMRVQSFQQTADMIESVNQRLFGRMNAQAAHAMQQGGADAMRQITATRAEAFSGLITDLQNLSNQMAQFRMDTLGPMVSMVKRNVDAVIGAFRKQGEAVAARRQKDKEMEEGYLQFQNEVNERLLQEVDDFNQRMAEKDNKRTEASIRALSKLEQAQIQAHKRLVERTAQQISMTFAAIPFDFIGAFRDRDQAAKQAEESLLRLQEDTAARIQDIHDSETQSARQKARQIERIEQQSADRRRQIERDLADAQKRAFDDVVENFLQGLTRIIQARLQERIAEQLLEVGLQIAGSLTGGGQPRSGGQQFASVLTGAAAGFVASGFNPLGALVGAAAAGLSELAQPGALRQFPGTGAGTNGGVIPSSPPSSGGVGSSPPVSFAPSVDVNVQLEPIVMDTMIRFQERRKTIMQAQGRV